MWRIVALATVVMVMPASAGAQIIATLKNKFTEDNKNRATVRRLAVASRRCELGG